MKPPGRLGADRTAVPFHGDTAGDNFERLLALSGLTRREVFITNAVLCNPRDRKGNNAPPSRENLRNCAENLERQIKVVGPSIVVTLGSAALEATRLVEKHELVLRHDVRRPSEWNGLQLVPFYHPGARAMIHRNFATQSADYYFLGELVRRLRKQPQRRSNKSNRKLEEAWDIVRYVIAQCGSLSLFRLHKLLYLIDYLSVDKRGQSLTNFVYIRQKDGPYCVELGSKWFKTHANELRTRKIKGILHLEWIGSGLFETQPNISDDNRHLIDSLVEETTRLSDSQLKTRAYLTKPMKAVLRSEREGMSQLNKPLL